MPSKKRISPIYTIVVGWKRNAMLDYLGSGQHMDVNLIYVVQDEELRLANAIYAGCCVVENSTFAGILVDNLFYAKTFIQEYSRLS